MELTEEDLIKNITLIFNVLSKNNKLKLDIPCNIQTRKKKGGNQMWNGSGLGMFWVKKIKELGKLNVDEDVIILRYESNEYDNDWAELSVLEYEVLEFVFKTLTEKYGNVNGILRGNKFGMYVKKESYILDYNQFINEKKEDIDYYQFCADVFDILKDSNNRLDIYTKSPYRVNCFDGISSAGNYNFKYLYEDGEELILLYVLNSTQEVRTQEVKFESLLDRELKYLYKAIIKKYPDTKDPSFWRRNKFDFFQSAVHENIGDKFYGKANIEDILNKILYAIDRYGTLQSTISDLYAIEIDNNIDGVYVSHIMGERRRESSPGRIKNNMSYLSKNALDQPLKIEIADIIDGKVKLNEETLENDKRKGIIFNIWLILRRRYPEIDHPSFGRTSKFNFFQSAVHEKKSTDIGVKKYTKWYKKLTTIKDNKLKQISDEIESDIIEHMMKLDTEYIIFDEGYCSFELEMNNELDGYIQRDMCFVDYVKINDNGKLEVFFNISEDVGSIFFEHLYDEDTEALPKILEHVLMSDVDDNLVKSIKKDSVDMFKSIIKNKTIDFEEIMFVKNKKKLTGDILMLIKEFKANNIFKFLSTYRFQKEFLLHNHSKEFINNIFNEVGINSVLSRKMGQLRLEL